jgi:DNA primase
LKIEEAGLTALVNKYIREKVTKLELQGGNQDDAFNQNAQKAQDANYSDEVYELLHQDELQERALIKTLIEHGSEKWSDTALIASHVFDEMNEFPLVEKDELKLILDTYKSIYDSGRVPAITDFIYSPDNIISTNVIAITNFPYEISKHWDLEGNTTGLLKDDILKIRNYREFAEKVLLQNGEINSEVFKSEKDEREKKELDSNLRFLKLKKIRSLINQNLHDLQKSKSEEERLLLLQTHQHLKQLQMQIVKPGDTVYLGNSFA